MSRAVFLPLVFGALLCSLLIVVAANEDSTNLSDFFSEKDAQGLEASLVSETTAHGGGFGSAANNYQGAWALTLLSSANLSKLKAGLCKQAAADLSSAVSAGAGKVNLAEAADAIRTIALLACTGTKDADLDLAVGAAKEGLNSATPVTIFHATAILAGTQRASLTKADWQQALQSIVDLQKDDGVFGAESDDDGSLEASGQALEAIKNIHSAYKFESGDWETLSQIGDKASALVDKTMESLEAEANLVALVQILEGLQLLGSNSVAGEKISIEQENVALIADTLVAVKSSPAVSEAGYVLRGLQLCADNKFHVPIVVTTLTKHLSIAAKGSDAFVKVRVTDVMGASIGKAGVSLTSAHIGDHSVLSNVALTPASGGHDVYEFNFLSQKVEHGTYTLDLTVIPESTSKPYGTLKVKRTVRATTTASIASFEVSVQDAKSGEGKTQSVEHPNKLKPLTADYLQAIDISFAVRSTISNKIFHPHQAFVRLLNKKTGFEAMFVTRVIDKRQKLKIVVADAAAEMFKNQGGEYDIEVIVGDVHMDDAITWNVGTISLVFADDPIPEVIHGAKPELHHTHRLPEKRPLALVSLVFTAAILVSFLVLLSLIGRLNLNLRMPSGDKFLLTAAFHITLGAIMFLYLLYWWRLNMFECLTALVPLSILAVLLGSRVLN